MGVTPKDGLLPTLLFYYFLRLDLRDINSGSSIPQINNYNIDPLPISFPELLAEQRRIVGILDEAFAGIATAKANAEKNLRNVRELFESHLNAVFTQRGMTWTQDRLADICTLGDGNYSSKYPKASEFLEEGVPFLTATNLKAGTVHVDEMRYISHEQHSQLLKGHVRMGDLVVVVRGSSTGNSSIVPVEFNGANLNSQLAYLRPKGMISNRFLYYAFNSPPVQCVVKRTISGAAQPQLPNNKLLDILINYPTLSEQATITTKIDTLAAETQRLARLYEQKLAALDELKKSLLHRAFSGQL